MTSLLPITYNPFLGLKPEEAASLACDMLYDFAMTLPARPSLPHEKEDGVYGRVFTDRAWCIYEDVKYDCARALREAGFDPDAMTRWAPYFEV